MSSHLNNAVWGSLILSTIHNYNNNFVPTVLFMGLAIFALITDMIIEFKSRKK